MIVALVWLSGCANSVDAPAEPGRPAPAAQPVETAAPSPAVAPAANTDKRVMIAPGLQDVLKVTGVTSAAGTRGFLKIQVNVQNVTGSPKDFSYRIIWFDSDGQPLPLASTSIRWMLLAHETSVIAATAPTPSAKDFGVAFFGE